MPPPVLRCKRHPAQPAAFLCQDCQSRLCEECAATRQAQHTQYTVCCLCGGAADVLRIPRTHRSYLSRLLDAWRYPLSPSGLMTLVVAGGLVALLGVAGGRGRALGSAIVWSYVLYLLRRVAQGHEQIEPPDFTDVGELFRPARNAFLAMAVVWVPLVLLLLFGNPLRSAPPKEPAWAEAPAAAVEVEEGVPDGEVPAEVERPEDDGALDGLDVAAERARVAREAREALEQQRVYQAGTQAALEELAQEDDAEPGVLENVVRGATDPLVWLLLLFGVFYAPMALVVAAAGGNLLDLVSPVRPLRAILRIPGDYAVAVGALILLGGVELVLSLVGLLLGRVPLLGAWAASALSLYVPFVVARVLGVLMYVRGAEVGFLLDHERYEPARPGAEPRGTVPERPAAAPRDERPARRAPIALDAAPGPAAPRPRRAPIELDPEPVEATPARPAPAPRVAAGAPGGQGAAGPSAPHAAPPGAAAPRAAPGPAAAALQQALGARELARALALYRAAEARALPAELHLEVGRVASAQADYPLAVHALRAACAVAPEGPLAPRALVLMARVLEERMGQGERARQAYAHVLRHYPGSEAARFARGRLGPAA